LSSNIPNNSQGAIQQYPTNTQQIPNNQPTNHFELDITTQQAIQHAKAANQQFTQQYSPTREVQQSVFELDITPKEEQEQEQELTEQEKAGVAASDSKFPTLEFIAIVKKINSISNMISRDRKNGATQERLDDLQNKRKDLKLKKESARKALLAAGINPKDVEEGKA
jgi:hypothetical protein